MEGFFFCFRVNRLFFSLFSSVRWSDFRSLLFATEVSCIFCFTSFYLFQMLHFITLVFVLTFHYGFALFWLRLNDLARTKEACLLACPDCFFSETLFLFCKFYYTMRKLFIVFFLNVSCIIPVILTLRNS